ncbi:hypothetical protein [Nevskia ramosa]|uniref:hypothetical protein n=1 Tax=Nevskia ramosa TaxID=64002 RepID=UPI002353DD36|nr:hypothetical protein [Nevskia ramosa]
MKKSATPVLDVELFTRLYEFGGLMTYTVRYFDKVIHAMVDQKPTFNGDVAAERCKALNTSGTPAVVIERLIPFDGAFAKV